MRLSADNLPRDEIASVFHPLAIRSGGKLILIDTGNGPRSVQAGTGQMLANFSAAGFDPKQVEMVIISHFHGDHIGGLVTADGAPAFPNAEIRVPLDEWNYWLDDVNMNKAAEGSNLRNAHGNVRRVFGAIPGKNLTKFESGKEVAPGITSIATPGHTPGHTSFVLASGSDKLLVQADVTSGIALVFVRNPDWFGGGDMDGPMAVADAAQALRHAVRREDADDRLSPAVPGGRARREERQRLQVHVRWRDARSEWNRPARAGRF